MSASWRANQASKELGCVLICARHPRSLAADLQQALPMRPALLVAAQQAGRCAQERLKGGGRPRRRDGHLAAVGTEARCGAGGRFAHGAAGRGGAQVWSAAEGVSACMSRRGSAPPRGTASAAAITARTHSIRCARLRCSSTNCAGGCANAASSRRMLNSGNIISPQCPIAVCARARALNPEHRLGSPSSGADTAKIPPTPQCMPVAVSIYILFFRSAHRVHEVYVVKHERVAGDGPPGGVGGPGGGVAHVQHVQVQVPAQLPAGLRARARCVSVLPSSRKRSCAPKLLCC